MTPEEWVLSAPTILTVAGLDFVVHNNGHHIIVKILDKHNKPHEYHLWPSTGHWRYRNAATNRWGRGTKDTYLQRIGVRGLVRHIQAQPYVFF
jgi:hypothetical protein